MHAFLSKRGNGIAFVYAAEVSLYTREYLEEKFSGVEKIVEESDYQARRKVRGAYLFKEHTHYVFELPFPRFTWATIAVNDTPRAFAAVDSRFPINDVKDPDRKRRRVIARIQEDWLYTGLGLTPVKCKRDDIPSYLF